jgi:aryl-alcohol dehydrogenase-like predicted oxidoreductase
MYLRKLILGGEQFGLKDWGNVNYSELERVFEFANNLGFIEVDTSNIYGLGLSESNIRNLKVKYKSEIKVSTKVGMHYIDNSFNSRAKTYIDCSEKAIYKSLEDSMQRLNVNKVECLYLHYPDPNYSINYTISILEKIKSEGFCNYIGICNCDDFVLKNDINFSPLDRYQTEINLINYLMNKKKYINLLNNLKNNNVEVVAYSPLKRGLLTSNIFQNLDNIRSDINDRRSRLSFFNDNSEEYSIMNSIFRIAVSNNIDISDLSIKFLTDFLEVNRVILGFTKLSQIMNLNLEKKISLNTYKSLISC